MPDDYFISLLKPFDSAWTLSDSIIAIPMIIAKWQGKLCFLLQLHIIQSILRQEEQTRALQTHKVLLIADQTLPHFSSGSY